MSNTYSYLFLYMGFVRVLSKHPASKSLNFLFLEYCGLRPVGNSQLSGNIKRRSKDTTRTSHKMRKAFPPILFITGAMLSGNVADSIYSSFSNPRRHCGLSSSVPSRPLAAQLSFSNFAARPLQAFLMFRLAIPYPSLSVLPFFRILPALLPHDSHQLQFIYKKKKCMHYSVACVKLRKTDDLFFLDFFSSTRQIELSLKNKIS